MGGSSAELPATDIKTFICSQEADRNVVDEDEKDKSRRTRVRRALGVLGAIKFAPLQIPWERRMQTLAVASWILTFFLMGPGCLIFLLYLLFYTRFGFLSLLYFAWYLYDRDKCNQGGRRSNWVRNWEWWKFYCSYFPIKLIKTGELDPHKNYILGSHPHGILCSGIFGNFATEGTRFSQVFPGITPHLLTLEGHYVFPFYREYLMSSGACSASKSSINYLLSRPEGGHAAVLVVGGAPESLESQPGSYIVKLKDRKGFIKTALRHGASLVPVFSFGETDIYNQVHFPEGSFMRNVQNKLQTILGIAPCLFNGRGIFQYTFGIVPRRSSIVSVVGDPIPVEKKENPSAKDIDDLHTRYTEALVKLFYANSHQYTNPGAQLTIV